MGAASSSDQQASADQREVESLATSTGALPLLQRTFSKLADPQTNSIPLSSLKQCFSLSYENPESETPVVSESLVRLLDNIDSSIVDLFFVIDKEGVSWVEFVRGYVKCCGRMSASSSFHTLLKLYDLTVRKSGSTTKLDTESDEADYKITGSLLPSDIEMLLWMCWTMFFYSRTTTSKGKENLWFPDISHLIISAVESCDETGSGLNIWDCDVSGLQVELPVEKFLTWAFATVPTLSECSSKFVNARLQNASTDEDHSKASTSSAPESSSMKAHNSSLLTCGTAWAISLTCRSTLREEILMCCFTGEADEQHENLLYRSSQHGRGMNRFWSNVEGYLGPTLILVSACSGDANEKKWVIGALLPQGFENKDAFYGSSGNLYSITPVFHTFLPSGKEKNFMYSHMSPTGRAYEAYPKPVGIAFGGTVGNERIFIDEDFSKVTIRHHAVDKTYQHGPLFPDQGFLQVNALISEVEVWGLGGRKASQVQASIKKREELFTNQRRTIDLKTFANWEDSPEKMMMDMMSNPNAVQREER